MFEIFSLANARFTLALNHWLVSSPALYQTALLVANKLAPLLILATLALLWFWPQPRRRQQLLKYPNLVIPLLQVYWMNTISREESRAQFLVLVASGVLGTILAQLAALSLATLRPFASFLPIETVAGSGAFDGVHAATAFPALQGVMLGAVCIALFFWNRYFAFVWIALSTLLALVQIALGLHWPGDLLGGALLGGVLTLLLMQLYQSKGRFAHGVRVLARSFELSNAPYCFILYLLLLLGVAEFLMGFEHLNDALTSLRAEILAGFGRR